jgi:hypothetical protein
MKSILFAGFAAAVLLTAGLGCGRLAETMNVNLFEGDNAVKAAAKIKEKVGAEVKVIRAEIRKEEMEITIQSPKNPKDIDKYTFKGGKVTGPEPVQVISMGDLTMTGDKYQTTNIDEIGFAAIPATIKEAIALSELENASVDLVSMAYEHPSATTPRAEGERVKRLGQVQLVFTWRLFVQGPRGRKDFWADKNGKLNPKPF